MPLTLALEVAPTRPRGSAIIGLVDRVDALVGRLDLRSPPGQGTSLAIDLPLSPP